MAAWGDFAAAEPELAAFVAERLQAAPSYLSGTGQPVDDAAVRAAVVKAASYDPADRYVLFELRPAEVRCTGYGDVTLPVRRQWRERGEAR